MKKISFVVNKYLQKNHIFDENGHRDCMVDCFVKLKKEFKNLGYDLSTNDINKIDESDFVIYGSDMPKKLPKKKDIKKSYLILFENHFIRPDNFDKNKHKYFNKLFTWHDEYIDGKKYIKLNYAHKFPKAINRNFLKKKKLCVMINSNKLSNFTQENDLYSKRIEVIRWFEANHPDDFDLFGVGWDKFKFSGPKIVRALNKVPFLPFFVAKLFRQNFSLYMGTTVNKKMTMENYRFSICYENAKDIPGYITEKIFDSFFAGCLPIYWGANNILDYIPKECFIDKRDFQTYEELYNFIYNMTDKTYSNYLKNIENYLRSDASFQFRSEGFVKTIIENMPLNNS